jgi:hypothetical protein
MASSIPAPIRAANAALIVFKGRKRFAFGFIALRTFFL